MLKKIFVRNPYNYDMNEASDESGLKCEDPSLAQQQFKEECDINTIVERFHLTGEVPQLQELPAYADYGEIFDFQTAMNQIRAAQEQFMSMPANIRARFHNEPQEFLEFCANADNRDEARKLGILAPDKQKQDNTTAASAATTGATNATDPAKSTTTPPQGKA